MNYITNSTDNQDLDITVNHTFADSESLNVMVTLTKDGNHSDAQSVAGTLVYNGYYSTLSVSGLDVDLETFYTMDILKPTGAGQPAKNIYKGKTFVTTQTIGDYVINNDNYIKQTTNSTNFTIFE